MKPDPQPDLPVVPKRRGRPPTRRKLQVQVEAAFRRPLRELLIEWRHREHLSKPAIADLCSRAIGTPVSRATVDEWIAQQKVWTGPAALQEDAVQRLLAQVGE